MRSFSIHRILGAIAGIFVGLHVPILWLLYRAFVAHREWWPIFMRHELKINGALYLVLTIIATAVCTLIGALIGWYYDQLEEQTEEANLSNVELSRQAATDGLTRLFNGAAIRERLNVELENSFRTSLSCLLIDIDHFKRINDKFGHAAGDGVLIQVASLLRGSIRRMDAAGRLGGEEFLVLLPGVALPQALNTAERIRKNVEKEIFLPGDKDLHVTVSVGVSNSQMESLNKVDLMQAADTALYRAKRAGRNRVTAWQTSFGFEVKDA